MTDPLIVAVDWTGARGQGRSGTLAGLAVAELRSGARTPELIDRRWTRTAIFDLLVDLASDGAPALVGFDCSFSLPFADRGHYFAPGGPADARELWRFVDELCEGDPDLGAWSLPRDPELAALFLAPHARGARFERRYRITEAACLAQRLGPATSCFHLIGPSQVGLGSLAALRLLDRLERLPPHLRGRIAIWPFDPPKPDGVTVIEIYTAACIKFAGLSGRKIRDLATLNAGLAHLGFALHATGGRLDDHATDAVIAAAALRDMARIDALWSPPLLTAELAATEGWTFGIP